MMKRNLCVSIMDVCCAMFCMLLLPACSKTEPSGADADGTRNDNSSVTVDRRVETLSSPLFGTTWKYIESVEHRNSGESKTYTFDKDITLGFSDKIWGEDNGHQAYCPVINGVINSKRSSWWYVDENGFYANLHELLYEFYVAVEVGRLTTRCMPFFLPSQVYKLTDNELVIRVQWGDSYLMAFFSRVYGSDESSSGAYEKPDVGYYDFTATRTSLKVQWRIYNRSSTKVTSAKVYYGTTRNPNKVVSASVTSGMITANLSGLKPGTDYYFKCVASSPAGNVTTEVTRLSMLY